MFGVNRLRGARLVASLTITLLMVLVLGMAAMAAIPILHMVSAGGPDICSGIDLNPGCDGNFSLVAIQFADGSVVGEYTDQWGYGFGGFHAVIDCLAVDGNQAWVSGVITQGVIHDVEEDIDITGWPVSTMLVDNGVSANDPPDQVSYSWISEGVAFTCTDPPEDITDYLFDMPEGQVKIK